MVVRTRTAFGTDELTFSLVLAEKVWYLYFGRDCGTSRLYSGSKRGILPRSSREKGRRHSIERFDEGEPPSPDGSVPDRVRRVRARDRLAGGRQGRSADAEEAPGGPGARAGGVGGTGRERAAVPGGRAPETRSRRAGGNGQAGSRDDQAGREAVHHQGRASRRRPPRHEVAPLPFTRPCTRVTLDRSRRSDCSRRASRSRFGLNDSNVSNDSNGPNDSNDSCRGVEQSGSSLGS